MGRNQVHPDWPPIKPFLRSALMASARRRRTLFVKVYMEGVPIGRKLDLLLLEGYDSLLAKLRHMFKTPITCKYTCIQLIEDEKTEKIEMFFRRIMNI